MYHKFQPPPRIKGPRLSGDHGDAGDIVFPKYLKRDIFGAAMCHCVVDLKLRLESQLTRFKHTSHLCYKGFRLIDE